MKALIGIWDLLLLAVLVIAAIASNEFGYGFIALLLLVPIGLLIIKVFYVPSGKDRAGQ